MTATATRSRKNKTAKAKATANATRGPRSIEDIKHDILKVQNRLDGMSRFDDEYNGLSAKAEQLQQELDVTEARTIAPLSPVEVPPAEEHDVELEFIVATGNHRELTHDADTVRLAESIRSVGVQQRIGLHNLGDGNFGIIWGHRRTDASRLAEKGTIPAKIYPPQTTADQIEYLRLIENGDRADLTAAERALAVARMIDSVQGRLTEGDSTKLSAAVEAAGGVEAYVAQVLRRPAAWVRDRAYVNRLGGKARQLLAAQRITLAHARELAKLGDPADTDKLAEEVALDENFTGGRTATYLARRVAETMRSLRGMPWRLEVKFGKYDRACDGCPFNSKTDPVLFEHHPTADVEKMNAKAGTCLHSDCFEDKKATAEKLIQVGIPKVKKATAKDKDLCITAAALEVAGLVPDAIRPESFARRAKSELDPDGKKASSPRGAREPQVNPVHKAKREYREARDKWGQKLSAKLVAKLDEKPLSRVILHILGGTGLLRQICVPGYYHYGEGDDTHAEQQFRNQLKRNKKMAARSDMARLLGYLTDPTIENLLTMASQVNLTGESDLGQMIDEPLLAIAKSLGVETDTPPDRQKMIDDAAAKAKG